MSKLYVFGIGGTGSRVLKALTMLLAAGVKCNSTIVPVIIDPDLAAADLTRTIDLMNLYIGIHNASLSPSNNDCFFKTDISPVINGFRLPVANTQDINFSQFIDLANMSNESQALCEALFSETNLQSKMQVGFKGNPNIGSVVLNQFANSNDFNNLANSFAQGDKIFIISSIFGGTGASGFPLLLKNLRTNNQIPNFNLINNAPLGAITVLPYFSLQTNNDSAIDSSTFISKTKSALGYYAQNISANNSLDVLYYIGDNINNPLNNCDGGAGQQNPAHFIELASALAILNFEQLQFTRGGTRQTIHKEFGIKYINNAQNPLTFNDLANATNVTIRKRLIQMFIFAKYLQTTLYREIKYQPWAKLRKMDDFVGSQLLNDIQRFTDEFKVWLNEMSNTQRSFLPFAEGTLNDVFKMVYGTEPKKSRFQSYALVDNFLNAEKVDKQLTTAQQFMSIFEMATSQAFNAKFK